MGIMNKKTTMLSLKISRNRLLIHLKNYLELQGNKAARYLLSAAPVCDTLRERRK